MAIPAAVAKKIAEAKTSVSGNRIKDGEYILVVKQLLCESKHKGTMFIPELDVVEAEKTHETIEPNKIGQDVSTAWPLDKGGNAGSAALANIKQFFCALLDIDEATTTTEKLMELLDKNAGLKNSDDAKRTRGTLVHCVTYRKMTETGPNAGKEGCYPRFAFINAENGNTPEAIAERRAALDKAGR